MFPTTEFHSNIFSNPPVLLSEKVYFSECMLGAVQSYVAYGIFGSLISFSVIHCIFIAVIFSFGNFPYLNE